MKAFRLLDKKFRSDFKRLELDILFYKVIKRNSEQLSSIFLLKNIRQISFKFKLISIRNLCILTYRSRSVHSFFRVSRLVLKGVSTVGYLPGIQRLSW